MQTGENRIELWWMWDVWCLYRMQMTTGDRGEACHRIIYCWFVCGWNSSWRVTVMFIVDGLQGKNGSQFVEGDCSSTNTSLKGLANNNISPSPTTTSSSVTSPSSSTTPPIFPKVKPSEKTSTNSDSQIKGELFEEEVFLKSTWYSRSHNIISLNANRWQDHQRNVYCCFHGLQRVCSDRSLEILSPSVVWGVLWGWVPPWVPDLPCTPISYSPSRRFPTTAQFSPQPRRPQRTPIRRSYLSVRSKHAIVQADRTPHQSPRVSLRFIFTSYSLSFSNIQFAQNTWAM